MTRSLTLPRKMSLTDPRHLMRHLKFEALSGTEAEKLTAIAASEKVSIQTVKDSVRMVEQYRAQNSSAEMDFAIRSLVVGAIPKARQTLDSLLEATELVEYTDPKTGKKNLKLREDKTTRIEAMKIVTDLVGKVQPKAPIAEVNVNQTTQIANLSAAETTEERLRRLRSKQAEFNLLPPEVAAVPESIDRGDEEEDDGDEGDDEEGDGDNE